MYNPPPPPYRPSGEARSVASFAAAAPHGRAAKLAVMALLAMKEALGHPACMAYWTDAAPPCDAHGYNWKGPADAAPSMQSYAEYQCWADDSRLSLLDVSNCGLQGSLGRIGRYLGQLTRLWFLLLHNNYFTGPIPAEVTNLRQLRNLSIFGQSRTDGTLPGLSGPLPAALGSLLELRELQLWQNSFSGELPTSLGNLTKLVKLDIGTNQYTGDIPDLSKLKDMNFLAIDNCNLNGSIPAWLGSLPSLVEVNLQDNQLTGELPSALGKNLTHSLTVNVQNNYLTGGIPDPTPEFLNITTTGNCFLGHPTQKVLKNCLSYYPPPPSPPSPKGKSSSNSSAALIGGLVGGGVFLVAMLLAVLIWWRRHTYKPPSLGMLHLSGGITEFRAWELEKATGGYSSLLGRGGFGKVYLAKLNDKAGTFAAVKRANNVDQEADSAFCREIELLKRIHHRRLVNLLGYCCEEKEQMLVYEYMAGGSLYDRMHGIKTAEVIPWEIRVRIAYQVALALRYLHEEAYPPIIHRDIKSSNVLLTQDMDAKVADFGLCKEAPPGQEYFESVETGIKGSFGYLDPQYVQTWVLSEHSDVFSFGPVDNQPINAVGLPSIVVLQAAPYLENIDRLKEFVDPKLGSEYDFAQLCVLAEVARYCVRLNGSERPTMGEVVETLEQNVPALKREVDGDSTKAWEDVKDAERGQQDTYSNGVRMPEAPRTADQSRESARSAESGGSDQTNPADQLSLSAVQPR
eukprot:SM000008S22285  [mRNA]  locus=s8:820821:826272:- [translate_table: standard]